MLREIFGGVGFQYLECLLIGDDGYFVRLLYVILIPPAMFRRRFAPCQLEVLVKIFIIGKSAAIGYVYDRQLCGKEKRLGGKAADVSQHIAETSKGRFADELRQVIFVDVNGFGQFSYGYLACIVVLTVGRDDLKPLAYLIVFIGIDVYVVEPVEMIQKDVYDLVGDRIALAVGKGIFLGVNVCRCEDHILYFLQVFLLVRCAAVVLACQIYVLHEAPRFVEFLKIDVHDDKQIVHIGIEAVDIFEIHGEDLPFGKGYEFVVAVDGYLSFEAVYQLDSGLMDMHRRMVDVAYFDGHR